MLNQDYKDMLQSLLSNDVKFLVVGAYAMAAYGYPRATGDIDLWVMISPSNSEKVYKALEQFGAPLGEIDEHTFCRDGVIFQIGIAPRRIDIITHIDGVDFQKASDEMKHIEIDGLTVPFISMKDLIANKEATGREKDHLDAEQLRSISDG